MDDKLLDYLVQRVESIDKKVDELLKFKFQIIGGSMLFSAVISVVMQIYFK